MKYINNGSKNPNSKVNYLAIKGKRVYTGEEFEASEKEAEALSERFNIEPADKDFVTPVTTSFTSFSSNLSDEEDFEYQTEEDAESSISFFNKSVNILNNEKGVK
jgi:hypothetical protein